MSPARVPWTEEQTRKALELRDTGLTWDRVAELMGCSRCKLRSEVDAEYRENSRLSKIAYRAKKSEEGRDQFTLEPVIPKNPAYDPKRDGMPCHGTLTAALMGDPFPGRSEYMRRAG